MQNGMEPISKGQADRAGKALAKQYENWNVALELVKDEPEILEPFRLVQQWRAMQIDPTRIVFEQLQQISKLIPHSLVTFRLKRTSSIIKKLARKNTNLRLGSMDDIGGCRLIVDNIDQVYFAAKKISECLEVKEQRGVKDYIAIPQESGYRSLHIIAMVPRGSLSSRVEIQIRTRIQHSWATGVEAAGAIYGEDYKSPETLVLSEVPSENVERFFRLSSGLLALKERCPTAENVPDNKAELLREFLELANRKQILEDLTEATDSSFRIVQTGLDSVGADSSLYVLEYDREAQVLYATPFPAADIASAISYYNRNEEEDIFFPKRDTVLVYATSPEYLSAAFPNYSTNLGEFTSSLADFSN